MPATDTVTMDLGTLSPSRLVVAASPHVRSRESVSNIMWQVFFALVPAALFGIVNFGVCALVTIVLSVASAVACEAIIGIIAGQKQTAANGSAALTGLLLAMCLPPNIPWYMPVLGSIVAIGVAKQMTGGIGSNVFNPAHIGRAFLMASYPVAMTAFSVSRFAKGFSSSGSPFNAADAVTAATPLSILKQQGHDALVAHFGGSGNLYKAMVLGNHGGSIGETSALLLFLGGIYLCVRGYVKWQTPLVMIATIGLGTWLFGGSGFLHGDPLFHVMAGGCLIGAFFMATDPVTVPMSVRGQAIFAFGAGLITVLIRLAGGYPEGVCYAILLMNTVTPLIDKYVYPKKFGSQ